MQDFLLIRDAGESLILAERLQCSNEDRESCLATMDTLLELSFHARKQGLMYLQSHIEKTELVLLRKAITYVIDGIEPEMIYKILMTYVKTENQRRRDLLESLLVIDGMLAIQAGVNTLVLRELLSAYFGIGFQNYLHQHFSINGEKDAIGHYMSTLEGKAPLTSETTILDEFLDGKIDDRSLQRLLREVDATDLVLAACGASGKIQKRILENVSRNVAGILVDELTALTDVDINHVLSSQKRVREVASQLKVDGDILMLE
jgi:hypothetical protein